MKKIDRIISNLDDTEADKLLLGLMERRGPNELLSAQESRTQMTMIGEHVEEARVRVDNWGKVQGLRTGFYTIDAMTKGLVGGELVIISGMTSHGKTQLATNIAYQVARNGSAVLFVTLEMSKVELTSRIMKIAEPDPIDDLPIFYQLENSLDYRDINTLVKRAVNDGAKLVVIDHLHMMVRGVDNTSAEVGKIVSEFKKAAIKNDVPVVLLCHVRKINDKVDGKRRPPEMEDLKESGYIAQDADVVLLVHRNLEDTEANNDLMDVVLHKNRNRGIFKETRIATFKSEGVKLIEEASWDALVQGVPRIN